MFFVINKKRKTSIKLVFPNDVTLFQYVPADEESLHVVAHGHAGGVAAYHGGDVSWCLPPISSFLKR